MESQSHQQEGSAASEQSHKSGGGCYLGRWTVIGLIVAHLVTLSLLIASVFIALQISRDFGVTDDDILVHKKDNAPLRVQEHLNFLRLSELKNLSLVTFQKPTSLIFKIYGNDTEIYRLYSVKAVELEGVAGKTSVTLFLALGHRLRLANGEAVLSTSNGDLIQRYNLSGHADDHDHPLASEGQQHHHQAGSLESSTQKGDQHSGLLDSGEEQLLGSGLESRRESPVALGNEGSSQPSRNLMKVGKYGGGASVMPVAVPYPVAVPVAYPVMPVAAPMAYNPLMTCVNCGLYYGGFPSQLPLY